ncbi:MAG TPA: hypothetical protein PLN13_09400 [Bacteroidia bacterium]|nr:hypothetical protein [Bacteroidia bacterium]HRH08784.1 hypothetical protein [Bacteroidia bacterium]
MQELKLNGYWKQESVGFSIIFYQQNQFDCRDNDRWHNGTYAIEEQTNNTKKIVFSTKGLTPLIVKGALNDDNKLIVVKGSIQFDLNRVV